MPSAGTIACALVALAVVASAAVVPTAPLPPAIHAIETLPGPDARTLSLASLDATLALTPAKMLPEGFRAHRIGADGVPRPHVLGAPCVFTASDAASGVHASLSACQGFWTGVVRTPQRTLFLDPLDRVGPGADSGSSSVEGPARYALYTSDATDDLGLPSQWGAQHLIPEDDRRRIARGLTGERAPFFIELVIVNDVARFEEVGQNIEYVTASLLTHTHLVYRDNDLSPGLEIVLLAQYTFTSSNPVTPSTTAGTYLNRICDWAQDNLDLPYDHVALLTAVNINSVLSYYQGSMCTTQSCSIVRTSDALDVAIAAMVASTVGHAVGLETDPEDGGECDGYFVMVGGVSTNLRSQPIEWSQCSKDQLVDLFTDEVSRRRLTTCLTTTSPPYSWNGGLCGNGQVDEGEECDCGLFDCQDIDPCCYGEFCTLFEDAECSELDPCCDQCSIVSGSANQVCREAHGECDVAETCSGASSLCPPDEFKDFGTACGTDGGCAYGLCSTHEAQCEAAGYTQSCVAGAQLSCEQLTCRSGISCRVIVDSSTDDIPYWDGVPCPSGNCFEGSCVSNADADQPRATQAYPDPPEIVQSNSYSGTRTNSLSPSETQSKTQSQSVEPGDPTRVPTESQSKSPRPLPGDDDDDDDDSTGGGDDDDDNSNPGNGGGDDDDSSSGGDDDDDSSDNNTGDDDDSSGDDDDSSGEDDNTALLAGSIVGACAGVSLLGVGGMYLYNRRLSSDDVPMQKL